MKNLKKLTTQKILVTGGAGFIGSHLCEALQKLGNDITSLDNYLSGSYAHHINGIEYIRGSVLQINEIFPNRTFDMIFHFGEYSRVEQSLSDPITALENITQPISQLVKYWMSSGAKLIYSGSSTRFSDQGFGETLSPYTLSKSLNAQLINNFSSWYDLEAAIVYFYNVYGGRELRDGKFSTVIGKYKRLVEQGCVKLPVYGTGMQRRNFTHINDTISGILLAAERGKGDEYGIGADVSYSILDIVKQFQCEPEFRNETKANRQSGHLKTEKIKALGWSAEVDLLDHIKNFLHKKPQI